MMRPDSGFMTKAAQGGIAEVEMGRLALQHASNEKVKQFGQRMVDDHSNANDQLKQLASQKGVTLPTEVNAKQKSTINKLSQLSGSEFDRVYMADMVKDHQEDVAEFQHEANSGNDPDVKAFAGKVLPTLQDHLRMAEDARGQLNK
jgi:putative membrane protein